MHAPVEQSGSLVFDARLQGQPVEGSESRCHVIVLALIVSIVCAKEAITVFTSSNVMCTQTHYVYRFLPQILNFHTNSFCHSFK